LGLTIEGVLDDQSPELAQPLIKATRAITA